MESFSEKMQELQDQGLLEELTPEETEALKGGYLKLSRDYFPLGTPNPFVLFNQDFINPSFNDQGFNNYSNVLGG